MSEDLTEKYLGALLAKPTDIQKKLFAHWLEQKSLEDFNPEDLPWKTLNFFIPSRIFLHFPFELPDMEKAASIVKEAVTDKNPGKKIVIYGDRDADGVTSSATVSLFLTGVLNYPDELVEVVLPGENDKYGVTEDMAHKLIELQPDILIVLDSGSSNRESFEQIKTKLPGTKTIIFDHHYLPEKPEDYPDVDAFVNPMRLERTHSKRNLCTAGLSYMFIWALSYAHSSDFNKIYRIEDGDHLLFIQNGVLLDSDPQKSDITFYTANTDARNKDYNLDSSFDLDVLWEKEVKQSRELARAVRYFQKAEGQWNTFEKFILLKNIAQKKIADAISPFLALAGVGTVADSMSLTDDNRILVSEGLKMIQNDPSRLPVGFRQLLQALKLKPSSVTEKDIAFGIGPAINAAGRMGNARLAFEVLTESDPLEATKFSVALRKENEKRKELSESAVRILEEQISLEQLPPILTLYDSSIHRGISGLVASKFAEKYERPAMVLVDDGDCLRGSVRSGNGENVIEIIRNLEEWFIQSGGHEGAAGFSLPYDKKEDFLNLIAAEGEKLIQISSSQNKEEFEKTARIRIQDKDIRPSLWNEIKIFSPFGEGNPYPLLLVEITKQPEFSFMGKFKNHLKLVLPAISTPLIEGVWFFGAENKDSFEEYEKYFFAAEPNINYFFGQTKYQLRFCQSVLKETA